MYALNCKLKTSIFYDMEVKIQIIRQNIRKLELKMELIAKNKSCIKVHRTRLLTPNYILDVFRNLFFILLLTPYGIVLRNRKSNFLQPVGHNNHTTDSY